MGLGWFHSRRKEFRNEGMDCLSIAARCGLCRHADKPPRARPEIRGWVRPRPSFYDRTGRWHARFLTDDIVGSAGGSQSGRRAGLAGAHLGRGRSRFTAAEGGGGIERNKISAGPSLAAPALAGNLFMVGFRQAFHTGRNTRI